MMPPPMSSDVDGSVGHVTVVEVGQGVAGVSVTDKSRRAERPDRRILQRESLQSPRTSQARAPRPAATSSAICTAFSAAPLRRLSLLMNSTRPLPSGADWSARMRPTKLGSLPAACSGVGTSSSATPGARRRGSRARARG